jgi:hypothetical protein
MIKSAEELRYRKIEIDLRGPDGNVFYLIGSVGALGQSLGWCTEAIEMVRGMMMLGDYENALKIFDHHFGDYVILYR